MGAGIGRPFFPIAVVPFLDQKPPVRTPKIIYGYGGGQSMKNREKWRDQRKASDFGELEV